MDALVRKSPIRRAVFNPRNSTCGSARVEDLSAYWWTDNSDPDSLYIHACRWSDRTYHRVWPRPIPGYTCKRLEMKNRIYGGVPFWLYDANDKMSIKKGAKLVWENERVSCSAQATGSVSDRVAELENAIVNIFKWTGGKRVARECRRVLPDVHERLDKQMKQNAKVSLTGQTGENHE